LQDQPDADLAPRRRCTRAVGGTSSWAFRARVYLQRSDSKTEAVYLGEIELEVRPIRKGRASFMHEGRIEIGHIDTVAPPDWDEIGVVPTIYVVQRQQT